MTVRNWLRFTFTTATLFVSLNNSGWAVESKLAGSIKIPGDSWDLLASAQPTPLVNQGRLGGFTSSLHYDAARNVYYGLTDRGPGGGVFSFETRYQEFTLDVDQVTGAISNFRLLETVPFRTADGSAAFNGLSPKRLNNDPSVLGLSLDPEGIAVAPDGRIFISDEYGPRVSEFQRVIVDGKPQARHVRDFTIPDRLIPRDSTGAINYDATRTDTPAQVSGRQESRGFEGLALSPDGKSLWGFLQTPLAEEGGSNEGRRSRNTRIVEFDVATGLPGREFIYQLTDRAEVNAVIDKTNADAAADLGGTAQGRTLVISDAIAVSPFEFLVTERENRGIGSDNPALNDPVLSAPGLKAVYRVDIRNATDVSKISLKGTNDLVTPTLPGNPDPAVTITPVTKTMEIDVLSKLQAAGLPIGEKIEGLTFGPTLSNGHKLLLVGLDNDLSVSQARITEAGAVFDRQFEIFTKGSEVRYTPLDDHSKSYANMTDEPLVDLGALPAGFELLPSYIYAFEIVPEPATGLLGSLALLGLVRTRKR